MRKNVYHFTSRDAVLRQIVDRMNAGDSNMAVIKYAVSRMLKGHKTFNFMDRESKKRFMRAVIRIHADNRALFDRVAGRS